MKAFSVFDRVSPEYTLLVFAETAGKAKYQAANAGLYEYDTFWDLRALRQPHLDAFASRNEPYVAETNDDLLPGEPRVLLGGRGVAPLTDWTARVYNYSGWR